MAGPPWPVASRAVQGDLDDLPAATLDGDQLLLDDLTALGRLHLVLARLEADFLGPAPVMTTSSPSMVMLTCGSSTSTTSVPAPVTIRKMVAAKCVTPVASVAATETQIPSSTVAASIRDRRGHRRPGADPASGVFRSAAGRMLDGSGGGLLAGSWRWAK